MNIKEIEKSKLKERQISFIILLNKKAWAVHLDCPLLCNDNNLFCPEFNKTLPS